MSFSIKYHDWYWQCNHVCVRILKQNFTIAIQAVLNQLTMNNQLRFQLWLFKFYSKFFLINWDHQKMLLFLSITVLQVFCRIHAVASKARHLPSFFWLEKKKGFFSALSANLLTPPVHRLLFWKRCKEDKEGERYLPWFRKREGISVSSEKPHHQKQLYDTMQKAFLRAMAMTELTFTVEMLRLIGWFLWQRENGAMRSSPLPLLSLYSVFHLIMFGTGGSTSLQM